MATPVNLAHSVGECLYHIVFIPKYRKKVLFGALCTRFGAVFRELAQERECIVHEGHLMAGHVHMLIQNPPKHSVSSVIGCIKGKSAIWIARNWYGRQRNFGGEHFWARGFHVTTVDRDEAVIRNYIATQEQRDQEEDRQMGLTFK